MKYVGIPTFLSLQDLGKRIIDSRVCEARSAAATGRSAAAAARRLQTHFCNPRGDASAQSICKSDESE